MAESTSPGMGCICCKPGRKELNWPFTRCRRASTNDAWTVSPALCAREAAKESSVEWWQPPQPVCWKNCSLVCSNFLRATGRPGPAKRGAAAAAVSAEAWDADFAPSSLSTVGELNLRAQATASSPEVSFTDRSADLASNSRTTWAFWSSLETANSKGVIPRTSRALTCAPASSSSRTMAGPKWAEASISGLRPMSWMSPCRTLPAKVFC